MSIRVHCLTCRTGFLTSDDSVGRSVACPKCGAKQKVPSAVVLSGPKRQEESVFVPAEGGAGKRRGHPVLWTLVFGILFIGVGGVIAWPKIRAWLYPDSLEAAATAFLKALANENIEEAHRLSTMEDPPAIRSFRQVTHLKKQDHTLRGVFAPIASFHRKILAKFAYDPSIGRFTPLNPLGLAADTLDTLHDAKAKLEKDGTYKKMQSGDPNEIFEAAQEFGKPLAQLSEVLTPKKLIPSYKQLVLDAKPPLPPTELELALDFGKDPQTWDALLKRPFPTIKADGRYIFQRAQVDATVTDRLASSGDPPTLLHLTLVRFRLDLIDTGWKVISARREGEPEPAAEPERPAEPQKRSPGEQSPQEPERPTASSTR